MEFAISEEQAAFKASVERFMLDRYSLEKRRAYLNEPGGYSAANWQTLAELGLLALPFSEQDGGLGGDASDLAPIMECFGTGPLVEPFVATVLMAGSLVANAGTTAQKETWLPAIMAGEVTLSVAHLEEAGRYNLSHQTTKATRKADGFEITGNKILVLGTPETSQVIVSARTSGELSEPEGISLLMLPLDTDGLRVRPYDLVDGSTAMALSFDKVRVGEDALLGEVGQAYAALEEVLVGASLALCSEAIGIMSALHAQTLEYLKTRQQFGRAIGSFQALQHRMADLLVELEMARSSVIGAVCAAQADRSAWLREIAGTKALVSEAAMHMGQESIQLHGAMGTTDELIIGHYHKRLLLIQTLLGDVASNYRQHYQLSVVSA